MTTHRLIIRSPLVSKDRQRFNTNTANVYQPKKYRQAQQLIREQVRDQWAGKPPIDKPVRVDIVCCGHARGDVDNTAGALLDTVRKIVLNDDRKKFVPELQVIWWPSSDEHSVWLVQITELPDSRTKDKVESLTWKDFDDCVTSGGQR